MTEETDMAVAAPEAQASNTLVAALRVVSEDYLDCRGIAHRWKKTKDLHVVELTQDGHLVERHLECDRCTTVRRDRQLLRMDRWNVQRLEHMHPLYEYPKDYLMPEMKGVDHPKELVRFEQLTRALGGKAGVNRAIKKAAANLE
jgi:hypothetical protein